MTQPFPAVDGEAKRSLESLRQIARLAHRLSGATDVTLSIFENGVQHVVGAAGVSAAQLNGISGDGGRTLCGVVVSTGQPVISDDCRSDPDLSDHPAVTGGGVGAYLGFPLRDLDDTVIGSLCAWERSARAWSAEVTNDLRDLASCASTQLAFAHLAQERSDAHAELVNRRVFDTAVLDSLDEGVVACGSDGRLSLFNRASRSIHGVDESADDGAGWASTYRLFTADGDRMLADDEIPLVRAFAGEPVDGLPMGIRDDNGILRQFLATGRQLTDGDGRRIGAVVAMRDVTDERRRRRLDTAQLEVATQLARGRVLDPVELVVALARDAFETPDVAFAPPDVATARGTGEFSASHEAATTGLLVQRALDERRAELAAPLQVDGQLTGVLHVVGAAVELLDQQAASTATGLVGMLARHLERVRARSLAEDLSRARAELARVVDQVEDFVFSVEIHRDARVVPVMRGSSAGVFGGEIDSPDWREFFNAHVPAEDRAELESWRDELRAGRPAQMTCRMVGFDGVTRWVWTRSRPRVENGRVFVDGISTDVTQRQRLHLEREQLLRERAQQVLELEALDAAKSEFVATVAHEIRGPLGVLVTFADYAVEGLDGSPDLSKVRRNAAMVARTAGHLQKVVDNIFDLARYDAGAMPPQLEDVDLVALVAEAHQAAIPAAQERRLTFRFDAASPVPAVQADATQLRQALDNVIGNAIKYTPEHGEVSLRVESAGDAVSIEIADTGIGIPADAMPHLFSRFFRAGNARTPETPGTGLGLVLARSIVEANGGTLTVADNPAALSTGTLVVLLLPVRER